MKIVICGGLWFVAGLLSCQVMGGEFVGKGLSNDQVSSINRFTGKVNGTLIAADNCLTEIIVKKKKGLQCIEYQLKIARLNKAYGDVNKIDRKKRHHAVANNNAWYDAFRAYDRIEMIVKQIDAY